MTLCCAVCGDSRFLYRLPVCSAAPPGGVHYGATRCGQCESDSWFPIDLLLFVPFEGGSFSAAGEQAFTARTRGVQQ